MDEIREILSKFDLKQFLRKKIMLLAALVCAILSLLIDKGILTWDAQYEGRLLVAAVVLMLIWLVIDGLQRKYHKMARAMGIDLNADKTAEDKSDE